MPGARRRSADRYAQDSAVGGRRSAHRDGDYDDRRGYSRHGSSSRRTDYADARGGGGYRRGGSRSPSGSRDRHPHAASSSHRSSSRYGGGSRSRHRDTDLGDASGPPRGTSVADILARATRPPEPAPAPAPEPEPEADSNGLDADAVSEQSAEAGEATAAIDPAASSSAGLPASVQAAIAKVASKVAALGGGALSSAPGFGSALPGAQQSSSEAVMLTAHLTKPHRELYVGNLPPGTTGPQLVSFLNQHLKQSGMVVGDGGPMAVGGPLAAAGPVITCRISGGSAFGFAEFRSVEETVLALSLGALALGALQLRFGRPKAFITLFGDDSAVAAAHAKRVMELVAAGVPATPPPNAVAGAIFAETTESIRAGGSGGLGIPAGVSSTFAHLGMPQPNFPGALPGPFSAMAAIAAPGASATSAAAAAASAPAVPAPAPASFITPAMGAAVLAQTAAAPAPAPTGVDASAALPGASGPDRGSLSLEVRGGVELFTVEDLEGMFGAFGQLARCTKPQVAAGEEERAILEFEQLEDATTAQTALHGLDTGDCELQVRFMAVDEPQAVAPSRYVLLRNTVLEEELRSEEEAREVLGDVAAEARRIAPVVQVHRPAAAASSSSHGLAKPARGDAPTSVPVVIEFEEEEAAAAAALKLTNRLFEDRRTTAHCIPQGAFEAFVGTEQQPLAAEAPPADQAEEELD